MSKAITLARRDAHARRESAFIPGVTRAATHDHSLARALALLTVTVPMIGLAVEHDRRTDRADPPGRDVFSDGHGTEPGLSPPFLAPIVQRSSGRADGARGARFHGS